MLRKKQLTYMHPSVVLAVRLATTDGGDFDLVAKAYRKSRNVRVPKTD